MHPGQCGNLAGIHQRIGHGAAGIVHGDIAGVDPRPDKLIQQGERHGRGDKAVVLGAAVGLGAVEIGLNGDFLAGLVASGLAAPGFEMRKQRIPGGFVAGLSRELLQRIRKHFAHQVLVGKLFFPPETAPAVPYCGLRVMRPDHPAGKNPLPDAEHIAGQGCRGQGGFGRRGVRAAQRLAGRRSGPGRRIITASGEQGLAGNRPGCQGGQFQKLAA